MNEEQLKNIIETELAKESPDWRVIENATRAKVDSNPDEVRFSVDAGHIQRLGAELVAKQETALSELIKNAYDADATKVTLSFEKQDRLGGVLVIEDDGDGMDDDVVRSSWMRISTADKAVSPRSPLYKRVRAGRKGIGRFSVQRLGKRLRLETRTRGADHGLRVSFNWDGQFVAGRNLDDIFSKVERFPKNPDDHGTKLTIIELRDVWSEATLQKVWRSVILLQPPFRIAPIERAESFDHDPGFQVVINGQSRSQQEKHFSIQKSFLDQALATIQASIDETGKGTVTVRAPKLGLLDTQELEDTFVLTGPINLTAHYFIYLSSTLSGMTMQVAAEMGRNFGGLRIYRNGFRVLPYGEPADDWLRMDVDVSRRDVLFPMNNRNFFGEVHLSSVENPLFEETSSREGLLENEAYQELVRFARSALEWSAKRVASNRSRKLDAGQKDFVSTTIRKPSLLLRNLRENLEVGTGGSDALNSTAEALAEVEAAAVEFEEKVEADRARALEYEEMLRLLASLGLSISVFGHEIKGARDALLARMAVFKDVIGTVAEPSEQAALVKQQAALERTAERLFDIGGYIGGLMSNTESRELRELSVKGALDRFSNQFGEYMSRQKVTFSVQVDPPELRTTLMHSSELDSVLLNFLTNSIKSMRRSKVSERRVRMDATRDGKYVVIGFEDNGTGIPPGSRERVFDAFYTTTSASDDDGVAGPGTGLGLKIVSDIAESYGGYASIGEPSPEYTCRFEFRVLAASPAEGPE